MSHTITNDVLQAPDVTESGASVQEVRVKRWKIEWGTVESISSMTRSETGWIRYPTSKDAWNFGIWVNPLLFETISFAGGAVCHSIYGTKMSLMDALSALANEYASTRKSSVLSVGGAETLADYESLTFLKGDVRRLTFPVASTGGFLKTKLECPLYGHIKVDHPSVLYLQEGEQLKLRADVFELDLLSQIAYRRTIDVVLNKAFGRKQIILVSHDWAQAPMAFIN